jgi:hypothetical protein
VKNLLITITATLVCVGAYAQGKLEFDINSDNLIYFATGAPDRYGLAMMPADAARTADNGFGAGPLPLPGSSLYTGLGLNNTPGTVASLSYPTTFTVGLYGGTSLQSLSLQATTTIADVNNLGGIVPVNVTFVGFPAGTPLYCQEQVYDSRARSAPDAWSRGEYAGVGPVFQATPSAAVYSPIYSSLANSTLQPGTFVPTDLAQLGGGYFGGIAVGVEIIPEAGTLALVGLGAAVLMIYRRRR